MSIVAAVEPATSTSVDVAASTVRDDVVAQVGGRATRCLGRRRPGAWDDGDDGGVAGRVDHRLAHLQHARVGGDRRRDRRQRRPRRRRCPPMSTTTCSGPLKPGPKPSASRSYAWRWVVDGGLVPASVMPRRIESSGTASSSITARPATRATTGRSVTRRAQRALSVRADSADEPVRARPTRQRSMLCPAKPSSAGISVTAMAIATSTVAAAASPITVRNGMPTTREAGEGDDDGHPGEHDGAAGGGVGPGRRLLDGVPSARFWRWRVTMNRA